MRRHTLAAALLCAAAPAFADGHCDPRYRIECVPMGAQVAHAPVHVGGFDKGAAYRGHKVVRHGYEYVAIPQSSHRPVVTGDPFIGGSGYVRDVPAYPLAVQAPHALRPVPYAYGYVTNPAALPQDPAPAYVKVRVRQRHAAPQGYVVYK